MKRNWVLGIGAVAIASLASASFAAEAIVFLVSPQALPGTGQTVAEAKAGNTPIIPLANAGPNALITFEIWLHINPADHAALGRYYTIMHSGGFDVAGSNNSVKGTSFNLFRTFSTAAAQRRWESAGGLSVNGVVGGSNYVWQGTSFDDGGTRSGINSFIGPLTPPKGPDNGENQWLLGTLVVQVGPGGVVPGGGGFFDVFMELRNNSWGTEPGQPVLDLAWGFNDEGEHFGASNSANGGMRSTHPEARIAPEPATLALLGLGGLLIRRRRSA